MHDKTPRQRAKTHLTFLIVISFAGGFLAGYYFPWWACPIGVVLSLLMGYETADSIAYNVPPSPFLFRFSMFLSVMCFLMGWYIVY